MLKPEPRGRSEAALPKNAWFLSGPPKIHLFQPGNCSYAGETESRDGDGPIATPRGCLTSRMKLSRLRSLMSLLTAMGMLPNQGTWKLEKEGEGLAREQKDGPRPWGKAWEPTSTQRCPGTPSSREGTHPNIQGQRRRCWVPGAGDALRRLPARFGGTHVVPQARSTRRISLDCWPRSPLSRRTPMAR